MVNKTQGKYKKLVNKTGGKRGNQGALRSYFGS